MTKRTTIIIAALAIIALTGVPFVYAQHQRAMHPGMHGMHGGALGEFGFGRLERAKNYLGLSDAQVDQLKAIGAELREQNAPYRKQVRGGMMQVAQALLNDPNNVAAAQALLDQRSEERRAGKECRSRW